MNKLNFLASSQNGAVCISKAAEISEGWQQKSHIIVICADLEQGGSKLASKMEMGISNESASGNACVLFPSSTTTRKNLCS